MEQEKKVRPKMDFTSYQKFVIVILALLQFTVVLDFMILSPLGDILMKNLGMTTAQFGSVVSAYAFSAGISGFLTAGFADKFDRKKILMFFYSGFIIGTIFCGLAENYISLLIARIITGLFGGVIGSIAMAIVTDLFQLHQRGRVMGFVQMAFSASQILGIPAGLFIADKMGWHATFFMVVILATIIGVVVLMRLNPIADHLKLQTTSNPVKHLWTTIKRREYRIAFLAIAFLAMGGFMLMPFTSAFLVNNVLIPQSSLPIIFLFTGISSIITMPLIGRYSDRIDKFKLFTIGSALACVMIVIYTNLGPVSIWLVTFINIILFIGIMSRMIPASALNTAMPSAADRGAFMSISSSLQQLSGGLAAVFAGFVVVQKTKSAPIEHFDTLGYVMVGFVSLCVLLMFRVSKIVKQRMQK